MSVLEQPRGPARQAVPLVPAGPSEQQSRGPQSWARTWLAPLLLTIAAGGYLAFYFDRGWIPSDEGLLAHSAERWLQGELPHRDFDEMYTGGLTMLHGLALLLFGMQLTSLRVVLLLFSLASVPAMYWIASRQGPWWLAALTTACGFVWGVPNYFAGLPSWYTLFFSLFGVLALLKFSETGRYRWLLAAGICGGLALLVKIVGLYYIAAGLMFLMYQEQFASGDRAGTDGRRAPAMLALTIAACGLLLLLELGLLRHSLRPMEVVHYVLPTAVLCGVLVWNERTEGRGPLLDRLRHLGAKSVTFAAGAVTPVLIFALPYAATGSLADLFRGTIVLPQQRFEFASLGLQPLNTMLPALLPAGMVLWSVLGRWRPRAVGRTVATGLLVLPGLSILVFAGTWYYWGVFALRGLFPAVAMAAGWLLVRSNPQDSTAVERRALFLVCAAACLGSLVQYPFAFLIYFCYCAPLVLLALHFVGVFALGKDDGQEFRSRSESRNDGRECVSFGKRPAGWGVRWCVAGLLAFFLIFGILRLNAGYLTDSRNAIALHRHRLNLERAGLRVLQVEQQAYERLIEFVQRNSAEGSAIYAAPDCMEVYFLAERRNPTRTMYDFFDQQPDRARRLLQMLDEQQIQVIVINTRPLFSDELQGELAAGLETRFPRQMRIGNFVVGLRPVSNPSTSRDAKSSLAL